jgi:hypothetical protein
MGRSIPAWSSAYNAASNAYGQSGTAGDTSVCTGALQIAFAFTWNPLGLNGGTYPIKFCYALVSETIPQTIGPPGTNPSTYTTSALQSVVLPDKTSWTFQYTNDQKGDLSQIAFPAVDTLSYSWISPPSPAIQFHTDVFTRGIAVKDSESK